VGFNNVKLVGRVPEIKRLRQLVQSAADGTGGALLITGEPGIGKTQLVQAAAAIAGNARLAVRIGHCEQLEVEKTLGAPLRAFNRRVNVDPEQATAARTLLEAGASAAAGSALADRLLEVLEFECARAPMFLAVEDLQWSDPTTLIWLRAVMQHVSELPLLVVLTTRPPVPGTDLHRALAVLALPQLDLRPLSTEDAHILAGHVLESDPTAEVVEAVDRAMGNPLLVLAILDALNTGGQPTVDSIAALVRELDRSALRTLQIAAVLGDEIDPVLVAAVAGIRTTNLLTDLEAGAAAGIVVPTKSGFRFRHELHREAVLDELVPAARATLHLAAAQMLATTGAPALAVAEQYARGARPGDQEAVAWLSYAAREIVPTAPAAALRLCDIAIEAWGQQPPSDLLLTKVRALAAAGQAPEADELGRALLRDALAPDTEARLRRELAFTAFIQGRADVAAAEMERCGALTDDPALRARVEGEIAFARFLLMDHAGARAAAEHAIGEGDRARDKAAQVSGGAVLCFLDLFEMRLHEASNRAREIVELADRPDAIDAHVFQPWFIAALVWLEADRFDLLIETSRHGREKAISYGSAWSVPAYDAISAFGALRIGEIDDAAAAAEAALSYADGVDGFGIAVWCNAFLAQIALHRGADDVAAERIAAAEQWLERGRAQFGFEQVCLATAELHERRGQIDMAYTVLAEVWDWFVMIGVRSALPAFGAQLARLAARAGHAVKCTEVVVVLTDVSRAAGTTRMQVVAEVAAAWRDGDADRAVRAAELADRTPLKPLAAATFADAASLLQIRGRAAEADRFANAAAKRWSAMGADADAAMSAAIGRFAVPPASRSRFGVSALTSTERRVVGLVADGRANAEIAGILGVSRRTVESHVSAAYRKLDVTSRVAMARIALKHRIGS
jgi:DNA-binding CsgD family transcriptional regulator